MNYIISTCEIPTNGHTSRLREVDHTKAVNIAKSTLGGELSIGACFSIGIREGEHVLESITEINEDGAERIVYKEGNVFSRRSAITIILDELRV